MENYSAVEVVSNSIKNLTQSSIFIDILQFLIQLFVLLLLFFILYYLIHIGNNYVKDGKKVEIRKKEVLKFIGIIFLFIVLMIVFRIRGLLFEILSPFIYAIIFAYILNPFVQYLSMKGIKRIWGVLIIYLIISMIIFVFSVTLVPRITSEVKNLVEILPKFSNETYEYIYDLFSKYNQNIESLPNELDGLKTMLRINIGKIQGVVISILSSATNFLLAIFSKIINLVLVPVLAFYFLKDAEEFKKMLIMIIPKRCRKEILTIAKDIDEVFGGFIRGQLIVASLVGILTIGALLLLKVEFAVLVGIIAGIANIIPYFGPVIGIIPGVMFALIDGFNKAIWVVVIFTIIQQIESAVFAPKIVGESVGVHPVVVILSLIIGGKFFGLLGLLFAVPVAGVIKVLGKHFINYIARF